MKNHENIIAQRKAEAHAALKLSAGEKLGMFAKRTLVGSVVAGLLYRTTHAFSAEALPQLAQKIYVRRMGDFNLVSKNKILSNPTKFDQLIQDFANKVETETYNDPTRVALVLSATIAVTIGAFLTARSMQHYHAEQKFIEGVYADRLSKIEPNQIIPAAPTRQDLNNLKNWRENIRAQQQAKDRGDAVDAALFTML